MDGRNRLIVLPPSHFCERARWALDHMGVPYDEERWAVGPHVRRARRIAAGTSLPILVTGRTVIQGSDRILDWTGMVGGEPAVEARLASGVGVLVRQFVYAAALADPNAGVRAGLFDGVRGPQAGLGRLMWPATRRLMARAMNARPALLPTIALQLEAELDWLEDRLGGRRHLVGHCFGRADLTAASLLSPFVRKSAAPTGPTVTLPPVALEILARWRTRPALRWAQGLYDAHRRDAAAA